MKKFINWMNDTNGWIPGVIILAVMILAYGSILNVFPSFFFAQDVQAASGWYHLAGWILTAGAIYQFYRMVTKDASNAGIVLIGILLALSWCSFAGFSFH